MEPFRIQPRVKTILGRGEADKGARHCRNSSLAAGQGSIAFEVHAPNRFKRGCAGARQSRPSPSGIASRCLDRLRASSNAGEYDVIPRGRETEEVGL